MKKITLEDVKNLYKRILDGSLSREEADRIAYEIMQNYDKRVILYFPEKDEVRIRKEINFIFGIDLPEKIDQNGKVDYLHDEAQIKERLDALI
jgi:hypothetical protein